jgi:hypothetical protein
MGLAHRQAAEQEQTQADDECERVQMQGGARPASAPGGMLEVGLVPGRTKGLASWG